MFLPHTFRGILLGRDVAGSRGWRWQKIFDRGYSLSWGLGIWAHSFLQRSYFPILWEYCDLIVLSYYESGVIKLTTLVMINKATGMVRINIYIIIRHDLNCPTLVMKCCLIVKGLFKLTTYSYTIWLCSK